MGHTDLKEHSFIRNYKLSNAELTDYVSIFYNEEVLVVTEINRRVKCVCSQNTLDVFSDIMKTSISPLREISKDIRNNCCRHTANCNFSIYFQLL
jgi:hypothetical protein